MHLSRSAKIAGAALAGAGVATLGAPVAGITAVHAQALELPPVPSLPTQFKLPVVDGSLINGKIVENTIRHTITKNSPLTPLTTVTHKVLSDLTLSVVPRAKKPVYTPTAKTPTIPLPDNIVTGLLNGAINNADTISANVGILSGLIVEASTITVGTTLGSAIGALNPLHLGAGIPGALIGSFAGSAITAGLGIPAGAVAGALSLGAIAAGLTFPLGGILGGVGGTLAGALLSAIIPALALGSAQLLLTGVAAVSAGAAGIIIGATLGALASIITGVVLPVTIIPFAVIGAIIGAISLFTLAGIGAGLLIIPLALAGLGAGFVLTPLWAVIGMTVGAAIGAIILAGLSALASAPFGLIPGAMIAALIAGFSGFFGGGIAGFILGTLLSSLVIGVPLGGVSGFALGAVTGLIPALMIGALMSRVKSFPAGRKTSGNDAIDRFLMAQSTARLIDLLEALKTGNTPTIKREWSHYLANAHAVRLGAPITALIMGAIGALSFFAVGSVPGMTVGAGIGTIAGMLGLLAGGLLIAPVTGFAGAGLGAVLGFFASLIGHSILGAITGLAGARAFGVFTGFLISMFPAIGLGLITAFFTGFLMGIVPLAITGLLVLMTLLAGNIIGALLGGLTFAILPLVGIFLAGVLVIGGLILTPTIIGTIPGLLLLALGFPLLFIANVVAFIAAGAGALIGFGSGLVGKYILAALIGAIGLTVTLGVAGVAGIGSGTAIGALILGLSTLIWSIMINMMVAIPFGFIAGVAGLAAGGVFSLPWAGIASLALGILGALAGLTTPFGAFSAGPALIITALIGAIIGGLITGVPSSVVAGGVSSILGLLAGGVLATVGDGLLSAGGLGTLRDMGVAPGTQKKSGKNPIRKAFTTPVIRPNALTVSHPFLGARYTHGVELTHAVRVHV